MATMNSITGDGRMEDTMEKEKLRAVFDFFDVVSCVFVSSGGMTMLASHFLNKTNEQTSLVCSDNSRPCRAG